MGFFKRYVGCLVSFSFWLLASFQEKTKQKRTIWYLIYWRFLKAIAYGRTAADIIVVYTYIFQCTNMRTACIHTCTHTEIHRRYEKWCETNMIEKRRKQNRSKTIIANRSHACRCNLFVMFSCMLLVLSLSVCVWLS